MLLTYYISQLQFRLKLLTPTYELRVSSTLVVLTIIQLIANNAFPADCLGARHPTMRFRAADYPTA